MDFKKWYSNNYEIQSFVFFFSSLFQMENMRSFYGANSSNMEIGVDFNHIIQSTIQKKIPWKSLAFILIHLAPSLEKSNQVIEILVQELELWVSKVESIEMNVINDQKEHQNDFESTKNSEKTESEVESISSDTERSEDIENDVEFVNEKNEELEYESNSEVFQNEFQSAETAEIKLDILSSRFYEFI